jgi:hypothetical protein
MADYLKNVGEVNIDPFQPIDIFVNDMLDKVVNLLRNIVV